MQVYKAWSSSFGVCEGPVGVAVPAVTITVAAPRPRPRPKVADRPKTAPCPLAPEERRARPPSGEPATAAATAQYLRQAVALALVGRELGTEGMAAVLAARLNEPLALALQGLRDSGQLEAAIGEALASQALESRRDVPLARMIRGAVRRWELSGYLAVGRR